MCAPFSIARRGGEPNRNYQHWDSLGELHFCDLDFDEAAAAIRGVTLREEGGRRGLSADEARSCEHGGFGELRLLAAAMGAGLVAAGR